MKRLLMYHKLRFLIQKTLQLVEKCDILNINNKLSRYKKLTQPVVVDNNDRILWIPGLLHGDINYNENDKTKVINWIQR